MELSNIAKWIIIAGCGLLVIGGLILLAGKLGIGLGKLPGDIYVKKEKLSVYFPIVTSIVLSIILTIIINLLFWLFRK